MKHIIKGAAPAIFDAWKAMANEDWVPTYGGLQNPQKLALQKALLAEQGGVCCYCGRSVSESDSHIEHFRPQTAHEDLSLEYSNLFASCIRETSPGTPLHCGHAKGEECDEMRLISPLDPSCEERFLYTLVGEISPRDPTDERAKYMRELVKLDIPFLRNRREEVLRRTFDPSFIDTATENELKTLRDAFLNRDVDGRLQSFGHVLARYAAQCLPDAVNEPEE